MNEEVENEIIEEVENEIENENPEVIEKEESPIEAWKKEKEKQSAPPGHIPYSRFKEVNEERKTYQSKLAEYEEKLKEYEKKNETPKSAEELNIADFDTPEDYLKARDKALKDSLYKEWEDRAEQLKRQKEQEEYATKLQSDFEKSIEKASKTYPNIKECVDFINDSVAPQLSQTVSLAIVSDENAGEIIAELSTNPKLLKEFLQASEIVKIKTLARLSAKFDTVVEDEGDKVENILTKMPSIPKTIRTATSSSKVTKDPSKMSDEEYRAWRLKKK